MNGIAKSKDEERKTTEALKAAHKATITERVALDQLKCQALSAISKAYADGVALVLVNVADKTVEAK